MDDRGDEMVESLRTRLAPHLAEFRNALNREASRLRRLAQTAEEDRLFGHVAKDLRLAVEHANRAAAAITPEGVAQGLRARYCAHCGRTKEHATSPYCDVHCQQCAQMPVAPGQCCAMFCVHSRLGSGGGT